MCRCLTHYWENNSYLFTKFVAHCRSLHSETNSRLHIKNRRQNMQMAPCNKTNTTKCANRFSTLIPFSYFSSFCNAASTFTNEISLAPINVKAKATGILRILTINCKPFRKTNEIKNLLLTQSKRWSIYQDSENLSTQVVFFKMAVHILFLKYVRWM